MLFEEKIDEYIHMITGKAFGFEVDTSKDENSIKTAWVNCKK